jgi:EAL domain-containing protein (putative c-di-GMP-specific phosphodiesterase class I)
MAQTLGMVTTAESVEKEQLTLLRTSGCQEVQGYPLSRPKPATEIRKFLQEQQEKTMRFESGAFSNYLNFLRRLEGLAL